MLELLRAPILLLLVIALVENRPQRPSLVKVGLASYLLIEERELEAGGLN